ncbi:hypothetical protein [Emticicia fluvialis]|uniref:hypothetical protein n=1 Tax=Emticicia fluvialis TaxID=2974474 RepID=UPI00216668DB|nr:hypothetical protein [Emticicia fluvialis]
MTNKIMRYARSAALPVLALGSCMFALSSCDKKGDPGPSGGGGTKGVNTFEVAHDTVGVKIRINDASTNIFTPRTITESDGTNASGFATVVDGDGGSRLAAASSTASNIPFSMEIDTLNVRLTDDSKENVVHGAKMTYVNADRPIMTFYPATKDGQLKEDVIIETRQKDDGGTHTIERHKHIVEAKLFASKNGTTLFGKAFTKATFKEFVKNSGKNTATFAKRNVMDLVTPEKKPDGFYYKPQN